MLTACAGGIPLGGTLRAAAWISRGSTLVAAVYDETFSATDVGANCGALVGTAVGCAATGCVFGIELPPPPQPANAMLTVRRIPKRFMILPRSKKKRSEHLT
jgi:hypothetical protein